MLARDGVPLFQQDPWGEFSQAGKPDSLFFVNLESPLSERGSTQATTSEGYNLCAPADQAVWLEKGGVSLVNTENNHKFDCGEANGGVDYEVLQTRKISVAGGSRNPLIYESNGIKVGVIAVDTISQPLDEDALIKKVKALRPNCDVLVVSLHWGSEYQAGVTAWQQELAQALADAGVDVLWGHHPHVLQKITTFHSDTTGREMLVMYSLGNLLSDQWMSEDALRSALVTVHFSGGRWQTITVTPIQMDPATHRLIQADTSNAQKINDRLGVEILERTGLISQP